MRKNRRAFIAQAAGALAGFALLPDLTFAAPRVHGARRKVAVIGIGRQGRAILDELRKLDALEIAAVCDIVPERVKAGQDKAPGVQGSADYHEVIARPDIEAVIIATATHLHRDIALAALAARKHVYCEAPLATTVEDCRMLAAAASSAASVFQSGFYARANPIYQRARSLVRSDSVRDTVSLYAQNHRKTSWRFTGGAAANWRLDPAISTGLPGELGSHQFDVAMWLRNKPPVRLSGVGSIRLHNDDRKVADTVAVELLWDDGVVLNYQATLANSYGGTYEVINGTNGSIRLAGSHGWIFKEADAATQGWEVYATRQQFHNDEGIVLIADATKLAAQGRLKEGAGLEHPPLYYSLAAFADSFINAKPAVCTVVDGVRATTVGILAHQAVVSGKPVEIAL